MLYTLQAKLLVAGGALLLLAAISGFLFYRGYQAGAASVQADFDKYKHDLKDVSDKELKEDRDTGYQLAVQWQHELSQLKARYDKLDGQYKQSLHSHVVCPVSGEVGDLVLPGDLVDSMFTTDGDSAAPSGSSAP